MFLNKGKICVAIYMMAAIIIMNGCGAGNNNFSEEAVSADQAASNNPVPSKNQAASASLPENLSGYPYGNAGISFKTVNTDGEWVFAADTNNNGKECIIKFCQDGSGKETIYENKNDSTILDLNAIDGWLYFSLYERKEEEFFDDETNESYTGTIKYYYICKIKEDGTGFEKIARRNTGSMWVYGDKIYFSLFSKRGDTGIYCMDIDGNNEELLFDKENIWFEIIDNKIYVICYDGGLMDFNGKCELFRMDIGGGEAKKISEFSNVCMSTICLDEKYMYYLGNDEDKLYRADIDGKETELLVSDVSEFCIQDDWIYFINEGYNDKPCSLKKIRKNGEDLTVLCDECLAGTYRLCGGFGDWLYLYYNGMKRVSTDGKNIDEIKK